MNRALFLDRDGVINVERGYVHRREAFSFQKGIFELCRAAQNRGYVLIVATNQAGIARGYYTESEFLELRRWMIDEFAGQQVRIAQVYYCPYHPICGVGGYKYDSSDRKPRPGMLLRARTGFRPRSPVEHSHRGQVLGHRRGESGRSRHEDPAPLGSGGGRERRRPMSRVRGSRWNPIQSMFVGSNVWGRALGTRVY